MGPRIAVITPTVPPRGRLLARAIRSVGTQTLPATAISIAVDAAHLGAPATRQRALDGVGSDVDWVAPLDDDDEFLPFHLEALYAHALETGADYVYSWFELVGPNGQSYGNHDPVFPPTHFTNEFDPEDPIETTVTILVRRELLQEVGYVQLHRPEAYAAGASTGEDRNLTLRCIEAGATIKHLVQRTWRWHHHGNNTSGRPDRWT
jgi:glycosyltransferase involved in cell wall biosynthesis